MLEVLDINDSNKWDEIVKSFKNYDVYYLSEYVKAFKIHGDGEPLLFYYFDENCKGINVVMCRDIANDIHFRNLLETNKYFDFSTPYGYGGWLIEGTNYECLFTEYEKWCLSHNIVSEFVRFHPVLNNQKYSIQFYEIIPLGDTVTVDVTNKELIWSNLSSKNRNVIRKAINNRVEIKTGNSRELYDTFINIYNMTMDKDNALDYYYFEKEFYDSIRLDLKENSCIFYAEYDGRIIATSIMIFANGKLNYHLSGSIKEFQYLAPSNLLLWKAAEWGNSIGCKTFHLGGGVGSSEDSLFKFKRAFYKGNLTKYYIGKKIFNNKIFEELVNQRNDIVNNSFFPEYRG